MVTPAARQEAVAHLRASLEVSERRACNIVAADRSSVRYRSRRPDAAALRARLSCWQKMVTPASQQHMQPAIAEPPAQIRQLSHVDDRQHPEAAPAGQLIVHEVRRPAAVRPLGLRDRRTRHRDPAARPAPAGAT